MNDMNDMNDMNYTNLRQKHGKMNLRKSFDSSLQRGKNGLTCYKYSIKTAELISHQTQNTE